MLPNSQWLSPYRHADPPIDHRGPETRGKSRRVRWWPLFAFVLALEVISVRVIESWNGVHALLFMGLIAVSGIGALWALAPTSRRVIAWVGWAIGALVTAVLLYEFIRVMFILKYGFIGWGYIARPVEADDAHGLHVQELSCFRGTSCMYSTTLHRRIGSTPFLKPIQTFGCLFSSYQFDGNVVHIEIRACHSGRTAPYRLEL
jgi:hypothetical protein